MAKKVKIKVKIQAPAGRANPAPPIGPALGQHGVNIMDFVNKFNEQTKAMGDVVIPAEITIYEDRTFDFIIKKAPVSDMIKKTLGIEKGSGKMPKEVAGTLSKDQLRKIAEEKLVDLNTKDVEAAMKIVAGTARSMGVKVEQ